MLAALGECATVGFACFTKVCPKASRELASPGQGAYWGTVCGGEVLGGGAYKVTVKRNRAAFSCRQLSSMRYIYMQCASARCSMHRFAVYRLLLFAFGLEREGTAGCCCAGQVWVAAELHVWRFVQI